MLVDSHCHLDHLDLGPYEGSLQALLQASRAEGVTRFLSVATHLEALDQLRELIGDEQGVYTAVGVHPLELTTENLPTTDQLLRAASHEGVVGVGETGIDKHYSAETLEIQIESFVRHARVAEELAKPLIVHTRDAVTETLDVIRRHVNPETAGVLHCFTESWDMARAALDMNFYISISGIVTFRNAQALRDIVKKIPLDRILVETDSPWLAPVPFRGKKNEPRHVRQVAECVAELKQVPLAELAEATSRNFDQLFRIPPRPSTGGE